jgi:hypothetical protein
MLASAETHLSGLTNLLELKLTGTAITEAAIEKLRRALPNASMIH